MNILCIHGRSQQRKDPVELLAKWKSSLESGLLGAGLELPKDTQLLLPFYGDRLDELVRELNTPSIADVIHKGAKPDSNEAEFRGDFLYEMARNNGITDADIEKHYTGTAQEKGPLNWAWVHAILRAFDSTPIGTSFLDSFTRDVYIYLTNKAVANIIDSIVREFISDVPLVVIGHSLGSIVGYNVLRSLGTERVITKFVTVGSPLGLKSIKNQLETPLTMPESTSSWFNAKDPRDVVALYPLDSTHFPIVPAITNKTNVNNHTENRHGIAGYLEDPDVARNIHSAMRMVLRD